MVACRKDSTVRAAVPTRKAASGARRRQMKVAASTSVTAVAATVSAIPVEGWREQFGQHDGGVRDSEADVDRQWRYAPEPAQIAGQPVDAHGSPFLRRVNQTARRMFGTQHNHAIPAYAVSKENETRPAPFRVE